MFRKPCEVGNFSLDIDRIFNDGKDMMKYYHKPDKPGNVCFDLKLGYKSMVRKDESKDELLNDILRWIMRNRKCFQTAEDQATITDSKPSRNLHTDFVCWRGLLTKLLCTPYENRDGWMIAVTLHKGTYYMNENETEKKKSDKAAMTERQDQMAYWGWKFEQYVSTSEPNGIPDPDSPVNNCEAYCTVIRSRLEKHSIVYSGEVDAVDLDCSLENKYVEFKTSREIDTPRQDQNFKRFKLIKWWAQSYLVGIPLIVCGFRDDDGIVHRLQNFETAKIPDIVKDLRDPWEPNVCFNFLNQFLEFVKRTVTTDNHKVVYLFEWEPSGDIGCRRLEEGSSYCFLPDWYVND
ncbi:hypothetical protein FSP39_001210 [Pinctada imbricata]|uniref:Decapping nuclease n=1 Tax=Pinctada imbricata TaxID=66713 RepID=A0AA88XCB5_PINIB|nr:hypothetical protein FSP39_001210 [Pinctada imbricata]